MAKQRQKAGFNAWKNCSQTFELSSFTGDHNHGDEVCYSAWISKKKKIFFPKSKV